MTATAMTVSSGHSNSGGAGPPSPTDSSGSQSELLASASGGGALAGSSALRRLHFKSARRTTAPTASLQRTSSGSPVPKVIVMGSSTASDVTINTSTDSAATAVTSVTSVTVTDDSLDAETLDSTRDTVDLQDSKDTLVNDSRNELTLDNNGGDCLIQEYHGDNTPSTAPPGYHRRHDPCLPTPAPPATPCFVKPQSVTDLDSPRPRPSRFIFDVPLPVPQMPPTHREGSTLEKKTQSKEKEKPPTQMSPKDSPRDRRSSEIVRVRRRGSDENGTAARLKKLEIEGSVVYHSNHQGHRRPSQSTQRRTSAQINVTPNPLDSPSPSMPTGRTTIVVQQPSVSLDYSGGYSTVLVKEEATSPPPTPATADGAARHRRRGSKRRDRRQQLQQLLDVNSQLTAEQLAEFEKRYGSPHHCRSQSVRSSGERQLLGLPQQRARVASMPNTGVEEEYYRLRHFSITGKGVINRGDSLRSRRSRSNTSVGSSASSTEHLTDHLSAAVARTSAPGSLASSRDSSAGASSYRVAVLGAPGVGKSSLVGQFMTSEYLHAYDTSIDDESGERSVCVLLGGEESELTFLDAPADFIPSTSGDNVHAYCVVYSTAERASLQEAERHLQSLWSAGSTRRRAVILVGNKADLARSRLVSTDEGKSMAMSYDCKFIETSVGINHNVDELLVGLLAQIRLKQQQLQQAEKKASRESRRRRGRSTAGPPLSAPATTGGASTTPPAAPPGGSAPGTPRRRPGRGLSASLKVRGLLGRVWPRDSKSKSCENLHVL